MTSRIHAPLAGLLALATTAGPLAAMEEATVEPIRVSPSLAFGPGALERAVGATTPPDVVAETPSVEPISFDAALRPAIPVSLPDGPAPEIEAIESPREPGSVRFAFGRETDLIDGGIGTPSELDDEAISHFESQSERFDRYNLNLEWNPAGAASPVQWLLVGGVHAIKAEVGRRDESGLTEEAEGVIAIPTVGTGVRWAPSEFFSFSTIASTQTLDRGANMLDISAAGELRLSPSVDLTAGYEFYRSDITVESFRTSLDREGLFARLSISF